MSVRTPKRTLNALLPLRIAFVVMALILPNLMAARPALGAVWNIGDVFLGVAGGRYQVRSPTGTLKETLTTPSGFTTGCAFDGAGSFYGTYFSTGNVFKFDGTDPHASNSFGGGYSTPESIVFDKTGNVYVGNVGNGIRKFAADGTFIKTVVNTRVDWLDLAADQDTILYTQEGTDVKRVSQSTGLSLPNFTTGTATQAFALRILADGGVLLADLVNIKRYNALGAVVQTYTTGSESSWFSLNLDPNGTSFWAGNFNTANYYRFNIATGAVEIGPLNTGTGASTLFGICLKGEITAGGPPPAAKLTLSPKTATNAAGTPHTVTAAVTDATGNPSSGVVVVFSVGGANTASGQCPTGATGQCTFTYTGTHAGVDAINAFADTNKNGAQDVGEPTDDATKTWQLVDQPITASGVTFNATEGTTFTGTVATFTDPDANATAAEYDATIDWGDGKPIDMGVISGSGGSFTVSGTHMYDEEGTYGVTVVITDVDTPSNTATAHSTANVGDAPLSSSCLMPPFVLQTYNGPTAKFTDQSSTGTLSDFTATINWGDNSSSLGTIAGAGGNAPYTVGGSHTYTSTGPRTVTTTINDTGGSTTTATCQVTVVPFATENGAPFVIGDLEEGIGNHVTWWSSQWANINLMSGGAAPDAMKGFAGLEDSFLGLSPLDCGKTWSTDPGNSTPPPPSVPKLMGVIVSSKVTKSGSAISGDIKRVVIVDNDPGYAPNPGHLGTGTELFVVCTTLP